MGPDRCEEQSWNYWKTSWQLKIFAGEIKEGDSIIVDVEYDGKPVVFNKRNNIQLSHWQKLLLLPLLVLLFLFAPLNHLQWL